MSNKKANENNVIEISSKKTAAPISTSSGCENELNDHIQFDPFSSIERISKNGTVGLNVSMNNYRQNDKEIIAALSSMSTKGQDPELDRCIVDNLMQLHNDGYAKESEDADRVAQKEKHAIDVFGEIGKWYIMYRFYALVSTYIDFDYSGVFNWESLQKLWKKVPSLKLLHK